MPTPRVNPTEYAKVETYAQIEMGRREPPAESLSFSKQIDTIIKNTGGTEDPFSAFKEPVDKRDVPEELHEYCDQYDSGEGRIGHTGSMESLAVNGQAFHPGWVSPEIVEETVEERSGSYGQVREKTKKSVQPPVFVVDVEDRDRPHRPEVANSTMFHVDGIVNYFRPRVPVADYDFQAVLGQFLDELEERYEERFIEVKYQ